MAVKVGINGFGRIGRLAARILGSGHKDLELVALNSRADSFQLAHLLKYDSVHRTYAGSVGHDDDSLTIEGRRVQITRVSNPADIPWKDLGVEIVLETTGKFTKREGSQGHLDAGAKKVAIGAPGKGVDGSFVIGVNHLDYDNAQHHIVSNASCTTNCLAPVAKVLEDSFGFEHGLMTTIHSYTMSQRILDGSHKDIRRARAAAMSIIPTTTGAARAVTEVIPSLKGKLDGMAIRVPTPNVSVVDLVCRLAKDVTAQEVNAALKAASQGPMKGALEVTDVPLVSVDYTSSSFSSVVDAPLTQVMAGRMVKILSWYDNEMGFTHRLIDLAAHMAAKL
ncbi:MAG: type I glyceraldehyde-3-phosphate dehydrogenase [Desulfarculus sp.]|nr:type I glyceraldehyde-3-phosphate dehydrogenase [Desulfarculus sp.]